MTEITDINGYACRAVPCASVVPSSSPSKPGSLSKRSRMDSISLLSRVISAGTSEGCFDGYVGSYLV